MKRLLIILLILFVYAHPVCAYDLPENISVSDYSGVISDGAKNYMKSGNDILFKHTQAKIIFTIVPSTDGIAVEEYCNNLYEQWDIASIGRNNSVFFVVDTDKNEYDFIVGSNINFALTDSEINEFIIESFEPYFSKGEYEKAFLYLFNSIGTWYESHYNELNLNLDQNIEKYIGGTITADKDKPKSNLWIWLTVIGIIVAIIITFKIKHNIGVKIRKMEREKIRRKYKLDIDKIVNP